MVILRKFALEVIKKNINQRHCIITILFKSCFVTRNLFLAAVLHWHEDWEFLPTLAIIQESSSCSFIDSSVPGFSQQTKQLKYIVEVLLQQVTWSLLHFFPAKNSLLVISRRRKNTIRQCGPALPLSQNELLSYESSALQHANDMWARLAYPSIREESSIFLVVQKLYSQFVC